MAIKKLFCRIFIVGEFLKFRVFAFFSKYEMIYQLPGPKWLLKLLKFGHKMAIKKLQGPSCHNEKSSF